MVTKKELLGLSIRVADKNLKVSSLQKELLEMFAEYLGYEDISDYEEKTGSEFWSDWFIDTIEQGSIKVTEKDIDIIIEQLKEKK